MATMQELSSLFCYQHQEESAEELKQKLHYMTYELQSARLQVEQQARKNREAMETTQQLLNLLHVAHKERDEAKAQLHKLLLLNPSPDSPLFNNNFHTKSASGVTESNSLSGDSLYDVVSPVAGAESALIQKQQQSDPESEVIYKIARGRPLVLPKKGKLLEAVIGAGPLLQTLMVAGPMPRWRNPPPLHVPIPGFDVRNPGGSPATTGPETGPRLNNINSVLNFAAGAASGSLMAPAPRRHRIQ